MLSRLCKNKNSIYPSLNNNNSTGRNEYQLRAASSHIHHHQSVILPNNAAYLNSNSINLLRREPPPPYQQATESRKIIPNRRNRIEEYRRRLSVSDSDSDDQLRPRYRNPPPRVKNEILLDEDLFCPDLVRNCKSLPVIDDDQDYIEIDELTSNLSLHNEVGLPNAKESTNNIKYPSKTMGQNVSLKRPKISLTWVLREQAQQDTRNSIKSFNWNVKPNEKVFFKKTSKSNEKLFSEKCVSDNNLNDFRGNTKKSTTTINEDARKKDESRKSEKIKRFHENCCKQRNSPDSNYDRLTDCAKVKSLSHVNLTGKGNYTEQSSIYVTSAQSDSGVNRRYKRYRRKKSPKIGYNINNVNEFLSKCSLSNPANIPVVLSNASILYQTRTGRQVETLLPLGTIVNSIFKNQNWLYVQTPHNEEGYVNFHACLPLGIIQRPQSMTTNCWETNTDIFPNPCGNLTDSEKEVQLHRSGARSEGRQTPKLKRRNPTRTCSEKYLDSLYLLASQPKIIDHAYAELKPTAQVSTVCNNNQEKLNVNINSKRKILLAITDDFTSDYYTSVKKGDVVRLLACKEYEDKIWYFIKNKDGSECYIPSSVATEFL